MTFPHRESSNEPYGTTSSKAAIKTYDVGLHEEPKCILKPHGSNAPWNPNIRLMLYFRLFNGIAYASRSAIILDAYLLMQFGTNQTVGLVNSLNGISSLIIAPFAGIVADSFSERRSTILKLSSVVALGCIALNYAAACQDNFLLIVVSSCLWRAWYEFVFVITESLFTDSIPPGSRSEFFVYRRLVTTLANGIGPLVALCLFIFAGNVWSTRVLHVVLRIGTFFSLPQTICLWFWKDVDTKFKSKSRISTERDKINEKHPLLEDVKVWETHGAAKDHYSTSKKLDEKKSVTIAGIQLGKSAVPWIVFISHVITFAGAGMTVKFFPLFFKEEYGFQPIHTCLLASIYTVSIATFTYIIGYAAKGMGRPLASLVFTFGGIASLFVLSQAQSLPLVIIVYLIRGGLQNASTPIDRSIMMDFINPAHTGKWTALQSVGGLSWSMSALLGGFLADVRDYRFTFIFTGIVYIMASLVYSPCVWLVPANESSVS